MFLLLVVLFFGVLWLLLLYVYATMDYCPHACFMEESVEDSIEGHGCIGPSSSAVYRTSICKSLVFQLFTASTFFCNDVFNADNEVTEFAAQVSCKACLIFSCRCSVAIGLVQHGLWVFQSFV